MGAISIKTNSKNEWIDITAEVKDQVAASKVHDGIALVYVPHTTAAVTINEHADPDVAIDVNRKLSELVPEADNYLHTEGNSDGHVKASLIGASQVIPISNGRLMLGTWQGIFFCEFEGPRQRQLFVKIIKE